MANEKYIIVPQGIVGVHSLDLWGTSVILDVLGPRVLEAYAEVMDGKENPEIIERNIRNYQRVLEGSSTDKKARVDAVEDRLWPVYLAGKVNVNFDGAIYQDALNVMDNIARADERIVILTTGDSPWVRQALTSLNPRIGLALDKVYSGDKSKPQVYDDTAKDIAQLGGQLVSHTEDQMKGLSGLLQSDLRSNVEIIYVERSEGDNSEKVLAAGVDQCVRNLNEAKYVEIIKNDLD